MGGIAQNKRMANIPNSFIFCAIVSATVISCGAELAPSDDSSEVSLISLDSKKPAIVVADKPQVPPPIIVEAVDVDKFNRMLLSQRRLAVTMPEYAAMSDFVSIFDGKSRAARGAVLTTASMVGMNFSATAAVWGNGGLPAMAAKLDGIATATPSDIAWAEATAVMALEADDYQVAGAALAFTLNAMMDAGYNRLRVLELKPMIDIVAKKVSTFLPFEVYEVQSGDSSWQLCRDFNSAGKGYTLKSGWIADFNNKRSQGLDVGEKLKVPSAKLSLQAWRGERLLALSANGIPIRLYEASFGRADEPTPLGAFTLAICEKEPVYYKQGDSPVPYANPTNPLGERWLGFKEDSQYGIHGTNSEDTIGSYESGGCLRLHNADVTELFELVKSGVAVNIDA